MRSTKMTWWLVALIGLAGCGEENPVELEGLVPGGGIRTGEVVLEASTFLAWDSVRTGFLKPVQAGFVVVAADFGGQLNARGLLRLHELPRSLSYLDDDGTLRVDSMPSLDAGRLTLQVDTVRTKGAGPIDLGLYRVDEDWHLGSANWENRVDSGSVRLPWSEPGGTRGALIGTAVLEPGARQVAFDLDSTALNDIRDGDHAERGLLVNVESTGARVEITSATLFYEMQPILRPDTLYTVSAEIEGKTFLVDGIQEAQTADVLLVGGVPTWRSYLNFKEGIDTIRVPCPGGPSGCTVRLSDVVVNNASLELQPVVSFPGFALLDSARTESRAVLPMDGVPIARLPLGIPLDRIWVQSDESPGSVRLSVTTLIRAMVGDSLARANAPRTIALLGAPEGVNLGLASFGSIGAGPLAPRLRLVYSVTKGVQDQ